jgi:hypothetical protein
LEGLDERAMPVTDIGDSDLYVASYDAPYVALRDFRGLEAAIDGDELGVLGALAMSRDADGKVDLLVSTEDVGEHGSWSRGATGIIVGLFLPELLLWRASPRGGSPALNRLIRAHDEGRIGVGLLECFPPESAVVVLVVARSRAQRIDGVLRRADKVCTWRIDDADLDMVRAALAEDDESVED